MVTLVISKQIVYVIDYQKRRRAHPPMLSTKVIELLFVQVIAIIAKCNPTLFDNSFIQCLNVQRDFFVFGFDSVI